MLPNIFCNYQYIFIEHKCHFIKNKKLKMLVSSKSVFKNQADKKEFAASFAASA